MEVIRTANAGVLLKLDGVSILLDGVCEDLFPYIPTPDFLLKELITNYPDVVAFTHMHKDHYDKTYAELYTKDTLRSVYGPELSHFIEMGNVKITPVSTRHIGKGDILHASFIIEGSKCVWFMGDASPLCFKNIDNYPKPDVLIVPYAYVTNEASWKITKSLCADKILVVHLPEKENDSYGLWKDMDSTVKDDNSVYVLEIGENIVL
ncbi:MAG: MBL fold metallo-hydrolase [Clostridia bacterium]|nr:MBL fold metallo-hydrolase [Clostridia bacterium]